MNTKIMKLDEIDKRILNAMQERGRISNAELADSINLSQSACYRLKSMKF